MLSLTAVLVGCSMVSTNDIGDFFKEQQENKINREFRARNKQGSEFATHNHIILVAYWQSANLVMMDRAGIVERYR